MSPLGTVRTTAVLTALGGLALSAVDTWGHPLWWAVPALAVAIAVSEIAVVSLQLGRQTWTFSLTESALGAAWVIAPGRWTVLSTVLGVLVAQTVLRRAPLKKVFNLSVFGTAAAAGSLTVGLLGGGVPATIAGLGVWFVVNYSLIAVAVAVTSQRRPLPVLLSSAPLSALHMTGNSSIGLLAAWLAVHQPLGLFGLVVPLALLWSSYDQSARRSQEVRLFAELAAGQEQATGRSSDSSARVVVTAAARLFGGADVELVLLAADGPVRYAGDESSVPQRVRVEAEVFDEPWVMRALGAQGVATGIADGRPWCSAVLGEQERPQAVLLARRPVGAPPFGRRETQLAQVLVGQAEGWLSVADLSARARTASERVEVAGQAARALGDIGAATAPALTVLRESADRLARLAETAGGVEDIVEELHLVERAVASLLGAVALAADPDLLVPLPQGQAPTRRSVTDWTTTGVLR